MKSGFAGFPAEGIAFLRGLKKNNNREWFQARKQVFEEKVKAPMYELVEALNAAMMKFAPEYATDPPKAVYRIYRDTRFSRDKTPYKTQIAAVFNRRGLDKHGSAGLYFSVSPGEIEVAGGVYMPGPEQLLAIRNHLSEHHEEFRRILRAKSVRGIMGELWGEQLSRVPKGFPADHPAADLLRYKQWLLYVLLDPQLAATGKLLPEVARRFRTMTPFVEFLNEPLKARKRRGIPLEELLG
jgi:uncharacterized protein (TIGR02453 family)